MQGVKTAIKEQEPGRSRNNLRMFLFFLVMLSITMLSCEKKVDWEMQQGALPELIVEGIITDEFRVQEIKLSKPVREVNAEPEMVSDAEVIVTVDGIVHSFHELAGQPGIFASDLPFKGLPGKEHSLLVVYQGKIYSAKSGMVPWIGNMNFDTYAVSKNGDVFTVQWKPRPYNPIFSFKYELLLDWSGGKADTLDTQVRMFYYTLPTLDVSQVFPPVAESVKVPSGTIVTERRYTLTEGYAAYLRALLSETTWQGGFFSLASATVPTNLSNGAAGFFTACSVKTFTDVIKGNSASFSIPGNAGGDRVLPVEL